MIDIPSTVKIALRALGVNKMRSALTMLGIIIGVGAVIIMLAVGTGASQRISEQISSIGSDLLIILPGATTAGGVKMGGWHTAHLEHRRCRGDKEGNPYCILCCP